MTITTTGTARQIDTATIWSISIQKVVVCAVMVANTMAARAKTRSVGKGLNIGRSWPVVRRACGAARICTARVVGRGNSNSPGGKRGQVVER
jgi:hypothetical protein